MLELMQVLGLSLTYPLSGRPPLFVHANIDLEKELLAQAAHLLAKQQVSCIILNGLTAKQCQELKVNYRGVELWQKELASLGVPPHKILVTEPARHTFEESLKVMELCQSRTYQELAFLSFPYHILRCTLTHLSVLQKRGNMSFSLFPVSLSQVDWQASVTKQLLGQNKITRPRIEMFDEELRRILEYQKKGDCASLKDMLSYFSLNRPSST